MNKKIGFLAIILIGLLAFSSCASIMRVKFDYSDITTIKRLEQENPKKFVKGPLRYLIVKEERKEWKKEIKKLAKKYQMTEIELQREFIEYFWYKRNTSINSERNELREQFYENLVYVEKNFQKGWNGDRGEIYLIFGQPDMWPTGSFFDYGIYRNRIEQIEIQAWNYSSLGYEDLYDLYFGFTVPLDIYFVRQNVGNWELAIWIPAFWTGTDYDLYVPVWEYGIYGARYLTALQELKEKVREDYIYDKDLTFEDYLLELERVIKWVPKKK